MNTTFLAGLGVGVLATGLVFGILARYMAKRLSNKGMNMLEQVAEEAMQAMQGSGAAAPASLLSRLFTAEDELHKSLPSARADMEQIRSSSEQDINEMFRAVADELNVPVFGKNPHADEILQLLNGAIVTVDTEPWPRYRKTSITRASRLASPFIVRTGEGEVRCEDGFLAIDARGYPYPIAADEFHQIYERVI